MDQHGIESVSFTAVLLLLIRGFQMNEIIEDSWCSPLLFLYSVAEAIIWPPKSIWHFCLDTWLPHEKHISQPAFGKLECKQKWHVTWHMWHDIHVTFLFFWSHGLWDLSSPTRDRTQRPLPWKHEVLTTGPPGNSQYVTFLRRDPLSWIHFSLPFLWAWTQMWYLQPRDDGELFSNQDSSLWGICMVS